MFPNVVQYSRINESKNHHERISSNISNDEINYAFKRCLEKGFLEKDKLIDYEFLKKRTLDRLKFPSLCHKASPKIHPLTFVISKTSRCAFIKTEKFLQDPLKIIHRLNTWV